MADNGIIIFLAGCIAVAFLGLCAYLAACAGASIEGQWRWLTVREWWGGKSQKVFNEKEWRCSRKAACDSAIFYEPKGARQCLGCPCHHKTFPPKSRA